jgi:hypothetical protein
LGGGGGVLAPFGGPGGAQGFWDVNAGVVVHLGSSSAPRVEHPEEPIVDSARAAVVNRTSGEDFTIGDDTAVRRIGGLDANARIQGVQFDNNPEMTTAPYSIPAAQMTAGDHTIKIRYRNPGDTTDHIKVVPLHIGEPARVPEGGNGSNYGAVLNMPATAQRPAPNVVGGASVPQPVPVGNIQTTGDFPANSTYILYVDGNAVGTPQPLPADHNTALTLPAITTDGPHQVQLRVMRPNQTTVIYPTVAVTVGPAFPTISAVDAVPDSTPPIYGYTTAPFSITLTSSNPGWVRITAGGNTWDRQVTGGANTIALLARGDARQHYAGTFTVQPLTAQGGTLVGTAVTSGHSVTLGRRAYTGGGTPAPRPPRL